MISRLKCGCEQEPSFDYSCPDCHWRGTLRLGRLQDFNTCRTLEPDGCPSGF